MTTTTTPASRRTPGFQEDIARHITTFTQKSLYDRTVI